MHILHLVSGRDVSPDAVHVLESDQEAVLHEVALHGRDIQPVLYLVVVVAEDLTGDVNIISWRQERDGQRGRREERRETRQEVYQHPATTPALTASLALYIDN